MRGSDDLLSHRDSKEGELMCIFLHLLCVFPTMKRAVKGKIVSLSDFPFLIGNYVFSLIDSLPKEDVIMYFLRCLVTLIFTFAHLNQQYFCFSFWLNLASVRPKKLENLGRLFSVTSTSFANLLGKVTKVWTSQNLKQDTDEQTQIYYRWDLLHMVFHCQILHCYEIWKKTRDPLKGFFLFNFTKFTRE